MAKTQAPGKIKVPGIKTPFVTDAVPDPFDARDLEYRSRLQPLPVSLDRRAGRHVMQQQGNSCTGHALAAVINAVLAWPPVDHRNGPPVGGNGASGNPIAGQTGDGLGSGGPAREFPHVSPYMLYHLARRYDEFRGDEDEGSSLRGALKGWFHHGVVLESSWPTLTSKAAPRLEDPKLQEEARERPLGAFYRVNALRLDDMQSAISELSGICASAVVHEGWIEPVPMSRTVDGKEEQVYVIARDVNAASLGGHAFALVGYNEVGFLVQNSWGTKWGSGGFATLPYEDWLESAYDAWVARPGVPKTPFVSGKNSTASATMGGISTVPAPDLRRLEAHVVNLENDGRLSNNGRFVSSIAQVEGIFDHMRRWHEHWINHGLTDKRRIVLYAHGGLIDEQTGLKSAEGQLNWWLNNGVYPVFFAWQSGPIETFMGQLADSVGRFLPFGGFKEDLIEQADRRVEMVARDHFRWIWDQMKQNAGAASAPIRKSAKVNWPPTSAANEAAMAKLPGASLTVHRLARYVAAFAAGEVEVHLVGHSAGSIFHAALLQRLLEVKIPARTFALMAPAIRVDQFRESVLDHLSDQSKVGDFVIFNLSDQRELDDVCGVPNLNFYHKSLLYLVSRALERPAGKRGAETPLLGLEKSLDSAVNGKPLRELLASAGASFVIAPSIGGLRTRSDAQNHGDFDDDTDTMTSVLARILRLDAPGQETKYQRYAALRDEGPARTEPIPAGSEGARPFTPLADLAGAPTRTSTVTPEAQQEEDPDAPAQPHKLSLEAAVAPRRDSPFLDAMVSTGWRRVDDQER